MAEMPAMPIWTDALLGDTSHLSPAEFGAYMRILLVMWRHRGYLPRDEHAVRRVTGMSNSNWSRSRARVLALLNEAESPDGRPKWSQHRLLKEYARALEKSAKQRQRALGGRPPAGPSAGLAGGIHTKVPTGGGNPLENNKAPSAAAEPRPSRGLANHNHIHIGGGGNARAPAREGEDDFQDPFGEEKGAPQPQLPDPELGRIRAAASIPTGPGCPQAWNDQNLGRWRTVWRNLGLTADEVCDTTAAVALGMPDDTRIHTPEYLAQPMRREAKAKARADAAATHPASKGDHHHGRPRSSSRDEEYARARADAAAKRIDDVAERLERELAGAARRRL